MNDTNNGRPFIQNSKLNIIKNLIVIAGPTASGKTSLSVALAKKFGTCVFSADSRQFYKELSIGTAKPTIEEQEGIPHFFIDSHSIANPLSAGQYEKEALSKLKEQFQHHDNIILVGGSGMFIDSLCFGLNEIPTSPTTKVNLEQRLESEGIESLLKDLQDKDPIYYNQIDKGNHRRVIRALEAIHASGKSMTELQSTSIQSRDFNCHLFILNHDREKLYDRINTRVDAMMNDGLLQEVENLSESRGLTALNTVGYKELFSYLDDQVDLNTAVEKIKQNTRRYAKRQLTWFNKYESGLPISYEPESSLLLRIIKELKRKGIEV